MNVFISADVEGVAGIGSWDQIMPGSHDYEIGRRLMTAEVNAAIGGAFDAGADLVVINDAHALMSNILPELVDQRARLVSGHFKPMYMLQGLDETFDAAFFIGYHGAIGSREAVLSHTYSPRSIWEARVDGNVVGEIGINAMVCEHFGVPVRLLSGDQAVEAEAKRICPDALIAKVKHSYSRYAAENLSPETARSLIREKASESLRGLHPVERRGRSVAIELTFLIPDMAEVASWIGGVERTGDRQVRLTAPDAVAAYRTFHAVLLITRSLAE